MTDRTSIGGNFPPDPIDEALSPFGDYIDEATGWLDGEPVETEDQLRATDELLKQIKTARKAVDTARDEATRPLNEAWKAEIARWKPTQDDLDRIVKGIIAAQDPFKRKLSEQKEAEKRAAWGAANKARREAEEAAAKASASDLDAQREAGAKAEAAALAQAQASAKQKDTVKGMRITTHHKIKSHKEALHWIAANDKDAMTAFIEEYVRKNRDRVTIDGVDVWKERVAA